MEIKVNIEKYKHQNDKSNFFTDVNFKIDTNGFFLLTGVSGIGKSTLMKIMLGIHDGILNGDISYKYNSTNSTGMNLRKSGLVGYQSDDFSLIPWKTVKENIELPSKLNVNLENIAKDKLQDELSCLGLKSKILDKYPHQLSFGMKARVGILRACIYNPKVVFLDELFSGVDFLNIKLIVEYLKIKKTSSIIIGISHQIERAIDICDKIIIINKKKELVVSKSKSIDNIINLLN